MLHIVSGDLWAGAEQQIANLTGALNAREDTRVEVLCLNPGLLEQRLQQRGVRVHVLDEQRLSNSQLLLSSMRLIRARRPDIIHSHRFKEHVLGAAASLLTTTGVCISTVHGDYESAAQSLRSKLIRALEHVVTRWWQKAVVAVSQDLASKLERRNGRHIAVITNSIDERVLSTPPAQRPTRPALKRIVFIGRIAPVKRIDVILQIARQAELKGLPYAFVILGDGPDRAQLQAAAPGNVIWQGFVADPLPTLAEADALILTSDHEGTPTVVLEALALGVPVVARQVGGIPEILRGYASGTLVNGTAPERWLDAIGAVVNGPNPAAEDAAHCRQRHAPHAQAEAYQSVYRRALKA